MLKERRSTRGFKDGRKMDGRSEQKRMSKTHERGKRKRREMEERLNESMHG
jgi:hypothetical protein